MADYYKEKTEERDKKWRISRICKPKYNRYYWDWCGNGTDGFN